MAICWYCYWGWAEPVCEIYERALHDVGHDDLVLHYGPSHVVWEDENFGDESIQSCFEDFDKYRNDRTDEEMAVIKRSLTELLAVPKEVRCCEPAEYDGEHPEKYPPTVKVRHLKR